MSEPAAPRDPGDAARKRRNVMLALALVAFVALLFFITLARLGSGVLERPL